jgi:hypothetical protein
VGILHVVSAALGGAAVGTLLGWAGDLAGAGDDAAVWVLTAASAVALVIALRRAPMNLGRPCQVPQRWSKTVPAERLYAVWGLMLGSGVVTLIPYSAHFVLVSAQFVAGPTLGGISGALYGATREAAALAGVPGRLQPEPAMNALERWAGAARAGNIAAVALGGTCLVVAIL